MTDILFAATIPGRPGILKNGKKICVNRKTGARFMASSDKYEKWAKSSYAILLKAKTRDTIDFPVNLKAVFYFKNHAHEVDLDNCYGGIQDLLQKCFILKDDRLIYSHDGSAKVFGEDDERIEITVTRYGG